MFLVWRGLQLQYGSCWGAAYWMRLFRFHRERRRFFQVLQELPAGEKVQAVNGLAGKQSVDNVLALVMRNR